MPGYQLIEDDYTDPQSPEYDPAFDKKIRAIAPDWFLDEAKN